MKYIREKLRKLKYELKFLKKRDETSNNYFVNSNSNSELTKLMNHYGSDKGGKNNHHNYADYYSELFFYKRNRIENFLEIGLGSNDLNILSNMGKDGTPLASLRAWRDFFPNANIFGADIDRKILKDEERIKTYYVDQTNPLSIKEMYTQTKVNKFDIILEDGLHEYKANICCFENSIHYLKNDGIYIIEDVYYKDQKKFLDYFKKTNYNFSIIDLYHKQNIANNCVIIIRKNENI